MVLSCAVCGINFPFLYGMNNPFPIGINSSILGGINGGINSPFLGGMCYKRSFSGWVRPILRSPSIPFPGPWTPPLCPRV